jgi:hypothetical protein
MDKAVGTSILYGRLAQNLRGFEACDATGRIPYFLKSEASPRSQEATVPSIPHKFAGKVPESSGQN